jgi:hypothetical protein
LKIWDVTETLMDEFILLFSALNEVTLTEDRDTIVWKWTKTGEDTTSSAYDIQFLGALFLILRPL